MRLILVNPSNPYVSLVNARGNRWNRFRVWPLGLLVLAGLTPSEWEVTIVDENLAIRNYDSMPAPDLVGITAFTSQAPRAYEVAARFRARGVPVVMGGIHATVGSDEALRFVDSVVTGEAEPVWLQVLADVQRNRLQRVYSGGLADMDHLPHARHDLAPKGYMLGSIQTTRGCPLACTFCSVSAVNGRRYRFRPIEQVIDEMRTISEKIFLVVEDNLIGTSAAHIARAKALFRAMADARLGKRWICQATINFGDDDELLALAAEAGCVAALVGFESPSPEGLREVGKKFNLNRKRNPVAAVRRMQNHGIAVAGSFIMGLDSDRPGVGRAIAEAASAYGLDYINALCSDPPPGDAALGSHGSRRTHHCERLPLRMEVLHPQLPGSPLRGLHPTGDHGGDERVWPGVLLLWSDRTPDVAVPPYRTTSCRYPGRESGAPGKPQLRRGSVSTPERRIPGIDGRPHRILCSRSNQGASGPRRISPCKAFGRVHGWIRARATRRYIPGTRISAPCRRGRASRPSSAARNAPVRTAGFGRVGDTSMVRRYAHLGAEHLAPYAERLCASLGVGSAA